MAAARPGVGVDIVKERAVNVQPFIDETVAGQDFVQRLLAGADHRAGAFRISVGLSNGILVAAIKTYTDDIGTSNHLITETVSRD